MHHREAEFRSARASGLREAGPRPRGLQTCASRHHGRVLAIAIINYETAGLTQNCVLSVQKSPPSESYEIVVVDNGSSAECLTKLRRLGGIRLIETGENGGFAVGVNRCLASTSPDADVVIVLNSDTEVEPLALDALAKVARKPGIGLAAPLLVGADGQPQRSGHRRFPTLATTWLGVCAPLSFLLSRLDGVVRHPTELSVSAHKRGTAPAHVMGAVMAIRRQAFDATGGFDEAYFLYFEETEWQGRLRAAGWQISLVPRARVRHLHRGGDVAIAAPSPWYLDSAIRYFGARGRSPRLIRAVLASAVATTGIALRIYEPLSRRYPSHHRAVVASRPRVRAALTQLAEGRRLSRPSGR